MGRIEHCPRVLPDQVTGDGVIDAVVEGIFAASAML
jgi:hypothetical protein